MRLALALLFIVFASLVPSTAARPAATSSTTLLSHIGGETHAVAVQGSYAFLAEAAGISVLDVSNPAAPALAARLEIGRPITDLAATEAALFVGTANGLLTVDISAPLQPALRGTYGSFHVYDLALGEGRLYVAAREDGLHILDVSRPHSPAPLGALTDHQAYAVAVAGTTAFTLSIKDVLRPISSIDVTDPSQPTVLAEEVNLIGRTLAIAGDRLLVAVPEAAFFYDAYVTAFDISDPRQLKQLGRINTNGNVVDIVAAGDRFVAAIWNDRVSSNQIGAVESFAVGQDGAVTRTGAQETPKPALSVAVAGEHAFIASAGLRSYALGADGALTPAGHYAVEPDIPRDVAIIGETALLADVTALRAYDMADPAAPVLQSTTAITVAGVVRMALGDDVAFTYDGSVVTAFDLSTPAAPALLGSVQLESLEGYSEPTGIIASGKLLFVNHGSTLQIVDASGPGAPLVRGIVSQEYYSFTGVALAGQYAYTVIRYQVSGGDVLVDKERLCAYDVSDLDAPADLGCQESDGRGTTIAVAGQYLYTYGGDEIKVYSLANPEAPVFVRSVWLPAAPVPAGDPVHGYPRGIVSLALAGDHLYAGTTSKIFVLDTTDQAAPRLLGTVATPGAPRRIQPAGDLLYVVDSVGGLRVLQVDATALVPPIYLPLLAR